MRATLSTEAPVAMALPTLSVALSELHVNRAVPAPTSMNEGMEHMDKLPLEARGMEVVSESDPPSTSDSDDDGPRMSARQRQEKLRR